MKKKHIESFVLRAHKDQSGQMFAVVAVMLVVLLGLAAFVIDIGRLYFSSRLLQTSTDAAALAGAQALPNDPTATAELYDGVQGQGKNAYPTLPGVVLVSVTPECYTTLTNEGLACVAPADANAVQVEQQVTVPMTFAALIGVKPITLTAVSTAAARGAARAPYNVVILVDSTASMGNSDGGSNCSGSRETCALQGVQTLLDNLSPCGSSNKTCSSSTPAVDEVSLMTFPAVSSASPDYCGGGRVSVQSYPLPAAPSYTPPSSPTYQIVNFSNDYRSSDTATSLNTSSDLAKAAGAGSCAGLQDPGGAGTYYAAAIYAAENLLLANQTARGTQSNGLPNTQNALIIISDGDANATQSHMGPTATNKGTYPSWVNQCHQAITAAQWAASQGIGGSKTSVYTVDYGGTTSGCTTDSPSITPCQTMQQMASSADKFYTDYTSSSKSCISASQPTTNLDQIFTEIAGDLSVARLIPNNLK